MFTNFIIWLNEHGIEASDDTTMITLLVNESKWNTLLKAGKLSKASIKTLFSPLKKADIKFTPKQIQSMHLRDRSLKSQLERIKQMFISKKIDRKQFDLMNKKVYDKYKHLWGGSLWKDHSTVDILKKS